MKISLGKENSLVEEVGDLIVYGFEKLLIVEGQECFELLDLNTMKVTEMGEGSIMHAIRECGIETYRIIKGYDLELIENRENC